MLFQCFIPHDNLHIYKNYPLILKSIFFPVFLVYTYNCYIAGGRPIFSGL